MIRLSGNLIDDDGVCLLADALRYNATVEEISLTGNKIGARAAQALISALPDNVALQTLGSFIIILSAVQIHFYFYSLDWTSDIQLHSAIEDTLLRVRGQVQSLPAIKSIM